MNTKAEVMQAFEDFQKGKLGTIPMEKVPSEAEKTAVAESIDGVHGAPTEVVEG